MSLLSIATALFVSHLSAPTNGYEQLNDTIVWPRRYEPQRSKFFVHNEIEIMAKPEKVWSILIKASEWEQWYSGASKVSLPNNEDTLKYGMEFKWKTMGLNFISKVEAFEQDRYLAWESKKSSIQGYHIWLIVPTANGCKVITEESQNGWLTLLEKWFQGKKLSRLHDYWLGELKKKAEAE